MDRVLTVQKQKQKIVFLFFNVKTLFPRIKSTRKGYYFATGNSIFALKSCINFVFFLKYIIHFGKDIVTNYRKLSKKIRYFKMK